jgi:hypothetical protein
VIKINKNSANTVVLTLTEKCTLTNPFFLFEFTNDQSKVSYTFVALDSSLYLQRYNRFVITEKTNPILTNSEVNLPLVGFYSYKIYEQISSTNLNVSNATGIVEEGKVKVIGTNSTWTAYDGQTKTNVIYNG